MANRTERMGAWVNETVLADVRYEDGTNATTANPAGRVNRVRVNNTSGAQRRFRVGRMDGGADVYNGYVPTGLTTIPDQNIPDDLRFWHEELPEGDPRRTNFFVEYFGT